MHWNFPEDTCELNYYYNPSAISQPYSAFINILIIYNLFRYRKNTQDNSEKIVLLYLILFEICHCCAHVYNVNTLVNSLAVHYLLTYAIVLWYMCFYPLSFSLYVHIGVDISVSTGHFFSLVSSIAMVISGYLFLAHVIYLLRFTIQTQRLLYFGSLIIGLIIIEAMYCEQLMSFAVFPYHTVIEITGYAALDHFATLIVNPNKYKWVRKNKIKVAQLAPWAIVE